MSASEESPRIKIAVRGLDAWSASSQALFNVSADFPSGRITAVMGASGCVKTTLLRCPNQIIHSTGKGRFEGRITIDGENVAGKNKGVHKLRRRFGVLAQKPNPFPNRYSTMSLTGRDFTGSQEEETSSSPLSGTTSRALGYGSRFAMIWASARRIDLPGPLPVLLALVTALTPL